MRSLARLHAMDVPLKKGNNWLKTYFETTFEKALKKFPIEDMFKDWNLETLKKCDLKDEIQWFQKTMDGIKSPIVFTHIDFRGSNIMVTEPNDEIILCDFEYSSYGYRGFDFGTIVVEWNRGAEALFKSDNILEKYPNDSQIKTILKPYVEESERIFGRKWSEDKINSMDQLVKEVKLFSMAANLFVVVFWLENNEKDGTGIHLDKRVALVSN